MEERKWYYKRWEPFYEQVNLGEKKTEVRPDQEILVETPSLVKPKIKITYKFTNKTDKRPIRCLDSHFS